ncbi:uncharacterized protein MJAP1_003395 [Malassezia japonica]|uniref:2-dehydropantoate 2-reductase n=1 Tax=Malassezia japonica TaxID=223818 RepID=A0AAF0JBV1_9BASI|nr:uncharacterized protein MJAP1_003395 [Malassezia japonica]WFD40409.1 hypothetical protein MJAP1_003395 [Malassezia japonica]
MQVHVVGVGAIGSLLAGHTRALLRLRERAASAGVAPLRGARVPKLAIAPRVAPYLPDEARSGVTLHLREKRQAHVPGKPMLGSTVTVERDGARSVESGYTVEVASAAASEPIRVFAPGAHGLEERAGEPTQAIESLIVATKADATYSVIKRLLPRITPATTVVLVQNGMGVLDRLLELWRSPAERPNLVLASATHGCFLKRPLHTVHAAFGSLHFGIVPSARGGSAGFEQPLDDAMPAELDLAAIPAHGDTESLRATVALLLALPLDVHWEPIRQFQLRALRKLIINACINPTTALVDCRNGELYGQAPATELFHGLCAEASQVLEAHARDARASQGASEADAAHLSSLPFADLLTQTDAEGLPLLDASLRPASMLREVENVVRITAPNWSSMHQDVHSKRAATEIDYINGYLSELGRTYGIPTPANDAMTALVKLKSQRVTGSWRVHS